MIEDCVIKRNGQKENNSFDKILSRVKKLGDNDLSVNYTSLAQKIIDRIYDEIPTQIDELTACIAHYNTGIMVNWQVGFLYPITINMFYISY